LSGVREDQPTTNAASGSRHVETAGRPRLLAKDVSEVNVSDLENIRVLAQVEQRVIELILGDANYARRYQNFLNHFPEIRKRSPEVKTFDLRMDDRITAKD
jgi:hypothetical protein